jgi:hypothetical protein
VPSFCRHNRLIHTCPICSREQAVELRPVVSSGTPKVSAPRPAGDAGRGGATSRPAHGSGTAAGARSGRGSARITVRRLARGAEDGYQSGLVPGLKSSAEAARLAAEIAFAAHRLELLERDPPGLLAELAAPGDIEERTWLAFQIAYICPLDEPDPFASIDEVRTAWSSGALPELDKARTGPRSGYEASGGTATLVAYRAWAARAGSQARAFGGEDAWMPERRFARVFERLALRGMHRETRYELLVLLGRTGVYELRGEALHFGGENEVTLAAKRMLGIGDPLLLERRAAELAEATGVPIEALDLALHNWGSGTRAGLGLAPGVAAGSEQLERVSAALGV